MDYIYLLALLFILILFSKYIFSISKLKKENVALKKQIEQKKCETFNTNVTELSLKQQEIDSKKNKIIEFLSNHETITNNQVENLLKVSNSTAYRLLESLEQEKSILQIGNTGRDVYYILNRYKK